jgi:Protein of unknown function (DUF3179)
MHRWWVFLAGAFLLLAAFASYPWLRNSPKPIDEPKDAAEIAPKRAELPTLPETGPPPGLPIVAWGPRDSFPVIRRPFLISASQGDTNLATDEPVLGLVLNGEARAYSTNQLNRHEMVVDQIGDTPILVTY